ncbi:atpase oscp/delta subunit [Lucifera butyrica]|uniref:ATP synthase subunit delta n=3 Tax=Lucifera butyrica TaxID=1351585 RepID=A0A498RJN2_9FIRM|nr:atpase oscp/delta subunit [Lucifera butyrica]
MQMNQLADKYAQAIYELAVENNKLESVGKELAAVGSTIEGQEELATLLYHPRVPAEAKKEVLRQIFQSELTDFVYKFLLLLVDKRRETALPDILKEYNQLANQARNIAEAEVTTALPLTPEEEEALAKKLSTVTGKQVILKTNINKSIIGGVIVRMGDKLIDGSVARQMQMLKTALMNMEVTKIGVTNEI